MNALKLRNYYKKTIINSINYTYIWMQLHLNKI